MLRALYDRTIALATTPHALWALAAVAFVESSVFPIPPDALLIPMVLARPDRAWRIAAVATAASVAGGLAGYGIGWGLFEALGQPILEVYGKAAAAAEFAGRFNDWGAWAVLVAGVTPFPYKVITIMSGWTGLDLGVFTIASLIARGLRFFLVAALLWRYGAAVRELIEKRLGLMFAAFAILLIGGFLALGAL